MIRQSLVGIIAMLLFSAPQARAQQPSPSGELSSPTPAWNGSNGLDFETRLRRLMDSSSRLSNQLQKSTQTEFDSVPSPPSETDASRAPSLAAPNTDNERKIDAIREQIRTLRRLRAERPDPKALPPMNQPVAPIPDPISTESPSPAIPQPSISKIERNIEAGASLKSADENTGAVMIEPQIEATEVVAGPVNSLALGQSLYRTKNYDAAMKAFDAVDATTLNDTDRSWLALMKAMTERRLKRIDQSEAILRDLANAESKDYPVKAAAGGSNIRNR